MSGNVRNVKVLIGKLKMIPKNLKSEIIYAKLLNSAGVKYIHHPKRFLLKDTTYQPDFYIPSTKTYIEVKSSIHDYRANEIKIKKFRRIYPNIKLKIVDPSGNELKKNKHRRNKKLSESKYGKFKPIKILYGTYQILWRMSKMEGRFISFIADKAVRHYQKTMFKKRNW